MKWIITGGCGFIGTNVVTNLVSSGDEVVVIDNLSRPRVHQNLTFLRDVLNVNCIVGDIRDRDLLSTVFKENADAEVVLHLAGQVSFLASLRDPRYDFEANALGTLNVLEALKNFAPNALLIYSSTNKVYGDLEELEYVEEAKRYVIPEYPLGIPTTMPLSLHGGYGCSKGAADQLVLDWSAFQNVKTVSFRQSSIYGGRQFATEDQGWAAFFAETFINNQDYTINGNGKQVRDLLHVNDLCNAFVSAAKNPEKVNGLAFNIGGGPKSNASLLELFDLLSERTGNRPSYKQNPSRPADQKVFIADIQPLKSVLGWEPQKSLEQGLDELVSWAKEISNV